MLIGSKPISLAATASMATWSPLARMTFLTTGLMVRGPGPLPAVVPSITAKMPGVDLLLDRQQVDQRLVDPGVGVVAVVVQQAAEGVLHRAGGRGVDVALDRGQVDDVLAREVVGDADALGEDVVQHVHLGLGLVDRPSSCRRP